jgi:hypothetical protein
MFRGQLRTALLISWLVVSAILLATALAPFALSAGRIAALTPVCEWKAKYGRECPLCGMTTGFILISHGEWRQARRHNRGSVPLYALFWANACAACFAATRLRRSPRDPFRAGRFPGSSEELTCRF